ncbi:hypothetical protein F7725_021185 [Dissostichus mawsoni]|uniref:Uncharacterized protein n=1 Tax=Dissostichus mawsoni TaxID=36200 RepID=A0A7J5YI34_DISMA|nr:hypothetical protein F7725_021185 [Dissostichus mawsoni]
MPYSSLRDVTCDAVEDEGLGLAVLVDLEVDLGVVQLFVAAAPQRPAVDQQRGSPSSGPTMAMNSGCCTRANSALIRDCIPVRLPN